MDTPISILITLSYPPQFVVSTYIENTLLIYIYKLQEDCKEGLANDIIMLLSCVNYTWGYFAFRKPPINHYISVLWV